jgi:uncharacterized lipoprotein YddW (UPF0748 family)
MRNVEVPEPAREFRAAWVASVANIDWPSKPGLSVDQQKREALAILDKARQLRLNAIILQIRPSCDALYESKLEPWSYFLTGQQGSPPDPYYDPLAFWIEEAHARGLELHAWFNPFRAKPANQAYSESDDHISRTRPELVKSYGGMLWLDPGEEEARRHSVEVFLDVTRRYDVDGIHIDDYFYPYPVKNPAASQPTTQPATQPSTLPGGETLALSASADVPAELPFPDDPAWERARAAGVSMSRDDWRRGNIDRLVEELYAGIKKEKPWVKFGISPFGLGKPALRPEGIVGFSQYDKLYADADLWFNNGWCDYWTPQLYWPIAQKGQQFPILLDYWIGQNRLNRHLWVGMFTSRVGDRDRNWEVQEIVDQIEQTRQRGPKAQGHVHFSMKALMENRKGLSERLESEVYAQPALIPPSPWLDNMPPPAPKATLRRFSAGVLQLQLAPGAGEPPAVYAVQTRRGDTWSLEVHARGTGVVSIPISARGGEADLVVVRAVDRCGNLSKPVVLRP